MLESLSSALSATDVEPFHVVVALVVVALSTVVLLFIVFRPGSAATSKTRKAVPAKKFLNRERQRARLQEIVELSHDTKLFRFALPEGHCLGLPCGKHIKVFAPNPNAGGKVQWNGNADAETDDEIERKYTPTSSDADVGRFDLVIKVYRPNERFSHGGKMSQYFDRLKVGDEMEFSGPWGVIEYVGNGLFKRTVKEHRVKEVGMIAGGTSR